MVVGGVSSLVSLDQGFQEAFREGVTSFKSVSRDLIVILVCTLKKESEGGRVNGCLV